ESKQTVPHFYLTVDLDADALVKLREQINEDLAASVAKDEKPEKISLNDLIVKACAIALRRVPVCNAQFTPDAILYHQRLEIVVGHRLACTLSCDHRVVDGAIGATFLKELRGLIERPTRILL